MNDLQPGPRKKIPPDDSVLVHRKIVPYIDLQIYNTQITVPLSQDMPALTVPLPQNMPAL
jgi:hypothetical protein